MPRTSAYVKTRILSLHISHPKFKDIADSLNTEGISITHQTVSKIVKHYQTTGTLADKVPMGPRHKSSLQHMHFIDQQMTNDDELTSPGTV